MAKPKKKTKRPTTKKEILKARKKAFQLWGRRGGFNVSWQMLSTETGLTEEELKYYKKYDEWENRLEIARKDGSHIEKRMDKVIEKNSAHITSQEEIDEIKYIMENSGLVEREKFFVMHYLQTYNVSQSALAAGYGKAGASVRGAYLMKQKKVIDCINAIKAVMHESMHIKTYDIINEYIKVAFADITDYVEFDNNKVSLKNSNQVDGRLITEVKQGRDGVTVKLADKMKALERLEKIFEVLPDKRLELDMKKFEFTKELAGKEDKDGKTRVTIIHDI